MAVFLTKIDQDPIPPSISPSSEVLLSQDRASPNGNLKEHEKRVRREIANSNERRRMQSINAGFQSLRNLLPLQDGEKLSKAAILQQTSNYIYRLEQEKTQLLNQIVTLKGMLRRYEKIDSNPESPLPKKRKRNDSMLDEGIGSPEGTEEGSMEDLQKSVLELRSQLDRERQYRKTLEEKNRMLESKVYPEKLKELTRQIEVKEKAEQFENLVRDRCLEELREQERRQLEEQQSLTLASNAASLMTYQVQTSPSLPSLSPSTTTTTTTTNNAFRHSLETIYKAIKHVEGGTTPVQTPNPTPTPEDDLRKHSEMDEESISLDHHSLEPEGRIRVIRQIGQEEHTEYPEFTSDRRFKVQLVHPLHLLTTRPSIIVS